jgi:hypothetical protein
MPFLFHQAANARSKKASIYNRGNIWSPFSENEKEKNRIYGDTT